MRRIDLPARYRAALRLARRFERHAPGFVARLPGACPYTLEQILGDGGDWCPAARP